MNTITRFIIWVILIAGVIAGVYYMKTKNAAPTPVEQTSPQASTPTPAGAPSGAPAVKTKSANFISQSTAVLDADINPNGAQTSYWYEYGTAQSLGSITVPQLLGSGHVTYSAPGYVSGLKSNTTYYYRAVAENINGRVNGTVSTFKTTLTPPAPGNPPVVSTMSASEVTDQSAVLNGKVDSNNSKTYFWFEYGSDSSLGNATLSSIQDPSTDTVSIAKSIDHLKPDTTYYFRLDAQNGYGTVNGSIRSFTTEASTPPPAPTGDRPTADTDAATNITNSSATLNGHVNPNGSATTYWFEYGRASLLGVFDLNQHTAEKSAGAGKTSKSFAQNISKLAANTTYYYRIVSKNQYGTDTGSIHQFNTKE